jgi:hypothetical protein
MMNIYNVDSSIVLGKSTTSDGSDILGESSSSVKASSSDSLKVSDCGGDSGELSASGRKEEDVKLEKDKGNVDDLYLISEDEFDDDINNREREINTVRNSNNMIDVGINNSSHVSHCSLLRRNAIIENYESLRNQFNIFISESSDDEGEEDPVSSLRIWRIPKRKE